MPSNHSHISTPSAPEAIGPYSQATVCGDLVYCSGQIALDPKSGEMIGACVASQTEQALTNLRAVLEAAGSSIDAVLKTNVYLKNLADFESLNAVYGRFFEKGRPARATVEVSRLPKDALVEIDCIARRV